MKKLSQEKQKQLALVLLLTAGALAGIWFGLISAQKRNFQSLVDRRVAAERQFQDIKKSIQNADKLEGQLADATKRLAQLEETMASGDLYAWSINTIRQFKLPYKVEIPQFSQVDAPKDVTLLAGFPYKQANMTIAGVAHYPDFGKFVADFENHFPYMRVLNLNLEPAERSSGDREKLSFRMEIGALVKPGAI